MGTQLAPGAGTMRALPRLAGALALACTIRAAETPAPFVDGDVVAVIGDSITHDGRWLRFVADYYATRFPRRTVTFLNCGIAGDMVGGALRRLDGDILARHPTAAVVMLGMNDVGRDAYRDGSDQDPQLVKVRASAQERYRTGMTTLLARLRETGVKRIIALSPTPYEDRAPLKAPNLPGTNDGLAACAATVRELAAATGTEFIDFHGPMTRLDRERQQADPAFTIVGPDRVHPGSPGHLVMAWLFLTGQRAPALVSRVELDGEAHRASAASAVVSDCQWSPDGVVCTVLAETLPFPLNPDAQTVRSWVPLERDLDREEFQATGLAAGTYRLEIDGTAVGTWKADELAAGINLAFITTSPTYRQAQAVLALSEQRRQAEGDLRAVALVEWNWLVATKVDPTDAAAATAAVAARVQKYPDAFTKKLADTYTRTLPRKAEVEARIAELSAQIREKALPKPHRYALIRQAQ